jgi:hypothetical protein
MLVARRDPFHPGAHDAAYSPGADVGRGHAPRLIRTVSMLQIVGSLLAIPLGLASAYSFYRANFSVETTCQSLRASIVSMIDKGVDASTRRILVRRDVEAFEQTCGKVDPDATAAFKALLAFDSTAGSSAPAATPIAPTPQRTDVQPKQAVRKIETHPQVTGKPPVAAWPTAAAAVVRHDPAVSDAQWVDAVRQALVAHRAERPTADAVKAADAPAAAPARQPAKQETALPAPAVAAPVSAPVVAPALPPAAWVAAPAVPPVDPDHPVPPGAIPESASPTDAASLDEHGHSRIRKWIAKVPLMGNVINNGW